MKTLNPIQPSWWDRLFPILVFLSCFFLFSWKCDDPVIPLRLIGLSMVCLAASTLLVVQVLKSQKPIFVNQFPLGLYGSWGIAMIFGWLSLTGALDLSEGVFALLKSGLFFFFGLLAYQHLRSRKENWIFWVHPLMVISPLLSVLGIFQGVIEGTVLFPGENGSIGTMVNPNLFASVQLLSIPILILALKRENKSEKILAGVGILLALVAIGFAGSRSSLLGIGMLIALFAPIFLRDQWKVDHPVLRRLLTPGVHLAALIIAGILGAGALFLTLPGKSVPQKLKPVTPPAEIITPKFNSIQERVLMYEKTVEMSLEHPFLGVGAGNWRIYAPSKGIMGFNVVFGDRYFVRPHNDFLWTCAEWGLVGGIAYLGFFVLTLVLGFRARKRATDPDKRFRITCGLMGVIGYMVIASLNFPMERVAPSILLSLSIALIFANAVPVKQKPKISPLFLIIGFGALTLATGIFSSLRFQSGIHLKATKLANTEFQWPTIIESAQKAHQPWQQLDPFSGTPLPWYSGIGYINQNNLPLAIEAFEAAYAIHPWHPHVLNDLATVYQLNGQAQLSIQHYETCHALFPDFEEATLNLTAAYFNAGRIQEADQTLKKVRPGTPNPKYPLFKSAIEEALSP